ncbi:MAG: DUF423 domain-containing protein [Elusimicrobiota bacterium]
MTQEWSFWAKAASFLMFLAVVLGAFAAHALKSVLNPERLSIYEVGVRYQAYHALALFAVSWLVSRDSSSRAAMTAGWCFMLGIALFSGSLYALSLTGARRLGAITPIGGLLFLIGWTCLFFAVP